MPKCDREEQRGRELALWVDRKVAAYLQENHSRFEATLEEQSHLAEHYPVILSFLNGEGAMELTAEEHQAIKEYLNLREKAEFLIREYHSYLGQAADISGLREPDCERNAGQETEENRTGRILELLAENQVEEADQMFRSSHPEYRRQAEIESEAQKAFYDLHPAEEMKTIMFHYVDAIHSRWLMFHKLFYQYAAEDLFGPSRKAGRSGRKE